MNDGYTYREVTGRRAAGRRVDAYLAGRYTHSTLEQWRAHIGAGRVLLDGEPATADTVLGVQQQLVWNRPPWKEPDAPLRAPVLHMDSHVLVVHKPAGLPTMAGGGFLQHTLVHQLKLMHGHAAPMHRLGRWTSGAVLCSRTPSAGAHLAAQFAKRSIDKQYRAWASGVPRWEGQDIDTPIGPVPYPPLGTVHAASSQGRTARSRVDVIERRGDSFVCDVRIATGRPHQIRIHLASVGHPLVGDPLFAAGGQPVVGGTAVPGDPGYHLHARVLAFHHPVTGARVTVRAETPAPLRLAGSHRPEGLVTSPADHHTGPLDGAP